MRPTRYIEGFTIVELMVTLFVAALFALSGWQLYSVVTARSAEARQYSEASNIAYSVLRSWEWNASVYQASSACSSAVTPVAVLPAPPTGSLEGASVTISRCNPISGVSINRVIVTVTYGPEMTEVSHGMFISN